MKDVSSFQGCPHRGVPLYIVSTWVQILVMFLRITSNKTQGKSKVWGSNWSKEIKDPVFPNINLDGINPGTLGITGSRLVLGNVLWSQEKMRCFNFKMGMN